VIATLKINKSLREKNSIWLLELSKKSHLRIAKDKNLMPCLALCIGFHKFGLESFIENEN